MSLKATTSQSRTGAMITHLYVSKLIDKMRIALTTVKIHEQTAKTTGVSSYRTTFTIRSEDLNNRKNISIEKATHRNLERC